MFKTNIRLLLLTTIFSTQFSLSISFAMNPDEDPSRKGIPTRQQHGGTINPTLQYQLEGQDILNQQPFNPSHIPPHPTAVRQQHGGTTNPTLQYQLEGQDILNQQPFDPSHIPPHPTAVRQQHGGTTNPTLQYQLEGQDILNQQPFDPSHIQQHPITLPNPYGAIIPEPVSSNWRDEIDMDDEAFFDNGYKSTNKKNKNKTSSYEKRAYGNNNKGDDDSYSSDE